MSAVAIEVYSDVVCPWCYVGKRRLERALAQVGTVETHVVWRPFQLNPTLPSEGMERRLYLEAKFGSLEAFHRLEEHVSDAGQAEGIPFAFERITRTPNTFQAHRLIWHAARQGRQQEMVDRLFKGYFEEGAEIGSCDTLIRLATEIGLEAEKFLQTDEGVAEVRTEEAAGHRLGIRSVPYFVFNGHSEVSGAQPVERFLAAIRQAQSAVAATRGR